MALIVEDGTGLANAESYVSVAFADDYHERYGNADWAALGTDQKEIALRKATQYLDSEYSFIGDRKTTTQALEWPRLNGANWYVFSTSDYVYNWPSLPLQQACCELALRYGDGSTPLMPDETRGIKSERVGPIAVEYTDASQNTQFTQVDNMLRPITRGGRNTIRIERV